MRYPCTHTPRSCSRNSWDRGLVPKVLRLAQIQGYLAHKNLPTPYDPKSGPIPRALRWSQVSYERSTPVCVWKFLVSEVPLCVSDGRPPRQLAQCVEQHVFPDVHGAVLALVVRQYKNKLSCVGQELLAPAARPTQGEGSRYRGTSPMRKRPPL